MEIHKGLIIKRRDMEVHHEEADLVIINQMLHAVPQSNQVRIIADDADIFVLAIHHHPINSNCKITMESLTSEAKVIDISLTIQQHKNIVPCLLQLHAFTGSDISGSYCSIGKISSLGLLKESKITFSYLGDLTVDLSLVFDEALWYFPKMRKYI